MDKKILGIFVSTLLILTFFSVTNINAIQVKNDIIKNTNGIELLDSDISIIMTPYNPPITIPSPGGNFTYSIEVTNNEDSSETFDVWTMYTLPDESSYGPVFGPVEFTLPAGWSSNKELSQYISGDMPEGNYTYTAYTGTYPDETWNSDSFTFEKLSGNAGWYQQNTGLDEVLYGVCFPDTEHGWAVDGQDDILYTSNGGDTWDWMDDGLYYNEAYTSVYFVDDQTGWIAGSKILHTTNGGTDWTEQYDPSLSSIHGIFFLDENNGYAVGGIFDSYNELFNHYILHTSDGGDNWNTQLYESGYYSDPVGPLNDIYFTDTNHGWAVGDYGVIYYTSDGGDNWEEQDSGLSGYYTELLGVAFTDTNNGWAVGEEGNIVSTTNGGDTWTQEDIGTTDSLNSICFTDEDNGWIAGGDYYPIHGTIFHTDNGGATWNLQDTGTGDLEYILYDIWFVEGTQQGWAAGGTWYPWEAVMLHTENGGGSSVEPILSYTPTSYDFGETYNGYTDSTNITIWNSGTGVLAYYLEPDCTWITVDPEEGFSSGEEDTITVTLDALGLQPGDYECTITIYSNGGTDTFMVYVTIIESNQELAYDPHEYDFGDVPQYSLVTTNLSIWNSGSGTLYYWIDDSYTFCVVEPWSGSSQGEVNIHTIMCFTSGLELGPNQCDLTIYSNGGNGIVTIYVNVTPHSGFNYPPMYSDEDPSDEAMGVSINTTLLSVYMYDIDGDTFDWSIGTSPNIGSGSGTGESNGTKTCIISGLEYGTTYTWYVNATDTSGSGETTAESYTFTTESLENFPPDAPIISGIRDGSAGSPYSYNFMSTDKNNDDVCYYIDWGDGTFTQWTSYQAQGQPGYNEEHTWSKGAYTIKAKVKDIKGVESDWTYLEITMPRKKTYQNLISRFLEYFPKLDTLVKQILNI